MNRLHLSRPEDSHTMFDLKATRSGVDVLEECTAPGQTSDFPLWDVGAGWLRKKALSDRSSENTGQLLYE